MLAIPNIASKRWVFEQYDSMVRTGTRVGPSSDAAVVRVDGTKKFLAMKTDCNSRYVYLNTKIGAEIAVAEAARNVICSGAKPIGITNCLNFGNPFKPESYWQFKEAVEGIAHACRIFETPVTGGNVSFYNENPLGAIYPTPVIGMVGLIEVESHITTSAFNNIGDDIILLGRLRGDINGSEYLKEFYGITGDNAPYFDIDEEKRLQDCCLRLIHNGMVNSAHDASEGGLAVALIESVITGEDQAIGCDIAIPANSDMRIDFLLFGEEQSRIVVSANPAHRTAIEKIIREHKIEFSILGTVTGSSKIKIGHSISLERRLAESVYFEAIGRLMD
jgi:phosphoribosylformylglycinamidine synthase